MPFNVCKWQAEMCGIALIAGNGARGNENAIKSMVASLTHRGPDENGHEATDGCLIGHTRLQVIDPHGGQQPMWDDTLRYCITFNGEIYNYRSLRSELEKLGVRFHSDSDTEVLLLAFRQWGEQCLSKLNGQFSFAVWDRQDRSVFAARDRLGEKPLFFAVANGNQLVLASEIRAILASQLITPQLDPDSVDAYLNLIYVPPNRTIYKNIRSLSPGHQITWRDEQLSCERYWEPKLSTISIDKQEAITETRRLVDQAVNRQMVADTTVGAFLSGGYDSSTIVGLMAKHASGPVKTFAVGFGDLINELPFARDVARQCNTDHAEIQMDIPVGEMMDRMASVYDEPFGDSSNIPTYLISEFAKRHCKVVLSGDGGDELFGGYSWYRPLLRQNASSANLSEKLFYQVVSRFPVGSRRREWSERYKAIRARRQTPDTWNRHINQLLMTDAQGLGISSVGKERRSDWLDCYRPDDQILGIDRAVDFDLRCYLPGDIFAKVDRAAMAHGLETRSPFMDVELVEFVLSLPASMRFQTDDGLKTLLRDSCGDLWPESIKNRKKQGFGAPIQAWLQRPDMQPLLDRVFQRDSPLLELIPNASAVRARSHRSPQTIWNLLCLGLWLERWSVSLSPSLRAA